MADWLVRSAQWEPALDHAELEKIPVFNAAVMAGIEARVLGIGDFAGAHPKCPRNLHHPLWGDAAACHESALRNAQQAQIDITSQIEFHVDRVHAVLAAAGFRGIKRPAITGWRGGGDFVRLDGRRRGFPVGCWIDGIGVVIGAGVAQCEFSAASALIAHPPGGGMRIARLSDHFLPSAPGRGV